jgi:hypothetical protein
VQGIGTRLESYTDCAAAVAAVFGRVIVLQKPKFPDRFGIRIKDYLVAGDPIVKAAIEQIRYRVPSSPATLMPPKPLEPPLLVP